MGLERGTHLTCVDPVIRLFDQSLGLHARPPQEYFDFILTEQLEFRFDQSLGLHARPPQEYINFIVATQLEFRFFKILFWSLDYWDLSEYDQHLYFAVCTMKHTFRQMAKQLKMPLDYDELRPALSKTINRLKDQAVRICFLLLGGEYKCKPFQQGKELFLEYAGETASFIEFVQETLEDPNLKFFLTTAVKPQIDFILGKLKDFSKFGDSIIHGITGVKKLGELMSQTRTWANHISCLSYLYWLHCKMYPGFTYYRKVTMPSDLMHKTRHYIPGVVASHLQGTLIPQLLGSYVDFLLEELVTLIKDGVEILREGLILLLSFLMDPPEHDSEERELILGQIFAIVNDLPSLISSIHCDEMMEGTSKTELSDFLQRIDRVKDEVREHYAMTPHSTQFRTPTTNAIVFLDSLLRNLKQMLEEKVNFIPRVKHHIQLVCEELASLRPFLQNVTELQNEVEVGELKDIWTRIVNVVYYAAYVTKLSSPKSSFMWYGIICLPIILEEIKLIETKLEGVFIGFEKEERFIIDPQMYTNKSLSVKMEPGNTLLPQPETSKVEGAFIGFREDARAIIDHLIGGRKDLTCISISGMPGQGKTTLARRIFNDPEIQNHFHKTVWCYVSKECKIGDLMIKIVHDVSKVDVEDLFKLEFDDVVNTLRQSLKGKKYLIVMDDIWDVDVWGQVQGSFPDDKIGNRILFTSRNKDLVSQTGRNCISYPLRPFSEEESWELMKEKLLGCNGLGPEFLEIGKQIAVCCKGLPLAVALVSSLLGKMEQKLDLWNQVAENLKSYLANEGCMQIIELSYKYLADHLKPCFLYFGAFSRGDNVWAKQLKLLWIAEGFIEENEMLYSEDLAAKYLEDLVSQSLVVVTVRNPMGGIKRCNVHDLLYDLCLEKIGKENFLHFVDKDTVLENATHSKQQKYFHHRVCFGESDPVMKAMPLCTRKAIPTSQAHSLLCREGFFSINDSDDGLNFSFLKSFKVLTVLDLGRVHSRSDVLPEVILYNIHLKYLALFVLKIDRIPPSIANLWNLETFILGVDRGDCINLSIPDTMWRMKCLRHVNIYNMSFTLENLVGNESYVAAQNIETLHGVSLGNNRVTLKFLRKLVRLRKLRCLLAGEVNPSWFSVFGYLKNLGKLHLKREDSSSNRLEACNFPQMMNLKKLTLEGLRLPWTALSTIGQKLPNLEVLKLRKDACVGSCWDLEDDSWKFSKLRYLELYVLNLERINVSEDCDTPFPCLERLVLQYCLNLKEIPSEFGDICTLNTIRLYNMRSKFSESAMQFLQQQRDNGNDVLQVIVINTFEEEMESFLSAVQREEQRLRAQGLLPKGAQRACKQSLIKEEEDYDEKHEDGEEEDQLKKMIFISIQDEPRAWKLSEGGARGRRGGELENVLFLSGEASEASEVLRTSIAVPEEIMKPTAPLSKS